jgi:two-component system, NtrC family, nitrogen regulation response regulator NtrX
MNRSRKPTVLVVDDDGEIRSLLTLILKAEGYEVRAAASGAEAFALLRAGGFNLAMLDYQLPDTDGLKILAEAKKADPLLPVIMMSGMATVKLAVEAVKLGADDFLEKPLDIDRTRIAAKNALEKDFLRHEVAALRHETLARYRMVGSSAAMQRLYEIIDRVAPSRASVLVTGESGAGKELTARAIHEKSRVAQGPFVRINCAAIPPDLIESELFGHEKGSFTGAVAQKPGKLEVANEGTLLLDEIGDMSLHVQAKLLRFLQEGEFERVGGTRTLKTEVRTIAATNKNLPEEMKQGRFREDLFYRLNVVTIEVPPLRERKEDIPTLAEHFLEKYCDQHGVPGKKLTPDAVSLLASRPWAGNVREFANVVQRCVVLLPQPVLTANDIAPLLCTESSSKICVEGTRALKAARNEFERRHVLAVLAECRWNITETARMLEIDRTGLYKILDRLDIKPVADQASAGEARPGSTAGR